MIVSVVGCGDSAKEWGKTPCDYSIGVNDCYKFGWHPDTLILMNAPFKFEPTKDNKYINRLVVIKKTKPGQVLTNDRGLWAKWFNCGVEEEVRLQRFWKPELMQKGQLYFSKTTPFIAITHAFNIGASEVILWGVDFKNHRTYSSGKRETMFEIEQYLALINFLKSKGIKFWVGDEESVFSNYLPVYGNEVLR